jgi:hypothetical protein
VSGDEFFHVHFVGLSSSKVSQYPRSGYQGTRSGSATEAKR